MNFPARIVTIVFWCSVFAPAKRAHHGAPAVVSLFATAAHTSVLGVLLADWALVRVARDH